MTNMWITDQTGGLCPEVSFVHVQLKVRPKPSAPPISQEVQGFSNKRNKCLV